MAMMERDRLLASALTLRDHVPEIAADKRTTPLGCAAHNEWVRWPCSAWQRASDHIGSPTDQPDDAPQRQS